ncbi:MAG: response regulator [Armatimonadetes bacterium]|nr:response regulator [Armatimonadota bacterium]
MRVHVADDDLLVRYTLRAVLLDRGHDVDESETGLDCVAKLRVAPPDCLVLDLLMPGCTGYDVLHHLQRQDPARRVKVIILSAFVVDADGFDRHPHVVAVLQKPLVLKAFVEALERCAAPEPVVV